MSAIGNYIHLHKSNYLKYGIEKTPKNASGNDSYTINFHNGMSVALNDMKQFLLRQHNIDTLVKEAKILEDTYNQVIYGVNATEEDKLISQRIHKIITEDLQEEYGKALSITKNYGAQTSASSTLSKIRNAIGAADQRISKAKKATKENLNTKLNTILKIVNEAISNKNIASDLKASAKEIKTRAKEIKNMVSKSFYKEQPIIEKISDSINALNSLISEYDALPDISNPQGYIGEELGALGDLLRYDKAIKYANTEIKKIIKSNKKGTSKDFFVYDIEDGIKDAEDNQINEGYNIGNTHLKVMSKTSKVDAEVSFTFPGEAKPQSLKLSIKNSNSDSIKLVDKTPLYDILMSSGKIDFVNHYLNIISKWGKDLKDMRGAVTEANTLARALAVNVAFQGYGKKNNAQMLLINDIKEGHIYIYSIAGLLSVLQTEMLMNNGNRYANAITGLPLAYRIQQYNVNPKAGSSGEKQAAVQSRIGSILKNVHDQKVVVKPTKKDWFSLYANSKLIKNRQ